MKTAAWRFSILILAIVLAAWLCGCGGGNHEASGDDDHSGDEDDDAGSDDDAAECDWPSYDPLVEAGVEALSN